MNGGRKPKTTIPFPSFWALPKYQFGQMVKQGFIVGLVYYPPGSGIEPQWCYWLLENLDSEELTCYSEPEIELIDLFELETLVKDEIEFYQHRITILKEQLKRVNL